MNKLDVYESRVLKLQEMLTHYEIESECSLPPAKIFELEGGQARVWELFQNEDVTIVKAHVTPNTEFPKHEHGEMEFIVVFKGYALYISDDHNDEPGRIIELPPGKCVSIPPGKPHRLVTEEEGAWFSVTTVPKAIGLV